MKNLLIMAMTIFIVFVFIGLFLKKDYYTTYELNIDAPILRVHTKINDLSTWLEWGVWNENDPTLKVSLGSLSQGKGATTEWQGPSGSGKIQLTQSQESHISYDVWFAKEALRNQGEFLLEKQKGKTLVKWNMWGQVNHPILGGYIAKFMEVMNRKMAEKSLQNLKAQLEGQQVLPAAHVPKN